MELHYTKEYAQKQDSRSRNPNSVWRDWLEQDAEITRLKHVCDLWHDKVNGREGWANRYGKLREAVAAVLADWDHRNCGDDAADSLENLRIVAGIEEEKTP